MPRGYSSLISLKHRPSRMALVAAVAIVAIQGLLALFPADWPPVEMVQRVIPVLLLLFCMIFGNSARMLTRPTGTPYSLIFKNIGATTLVFFIVLWVVSLGTGMLPPTLTNRGTGQHIHDYVPLLHTILGTSALGWWASTAYCVALCSAGLPRPTMAHESPRAGHLPKWLVVVGLLLVALGFMAIFQYPEIAQRMNIPLPVSAGLWTVVALASIAHSYIDCRHYDRSDRQSRLIRHATSHGVTS